MSSALPYQNTSTGRSTSERELMVPPNCKAHITASSTVLISHLTSTLKKRLLSTSIFSRMYYSNMKIQLHSNTVLNIPDSRFPLTSLTWKINCHLPCSRWVKWAIIFLQKEGIKFNKQKLGCHSYSLREIMVLLHSVRLGVVIFLKPTEQYTSQGSKIHAIFLIFITNY